MPSGRDFEVPLPLAAALRRRIADARLDQALLLEALERGVHRAHGHAAAAALLDLGAHRRAIGVGAEAQQRQHHDLLELAEDGRRMRVMVPVNIHNVD